MLAVAAFEYHRPSRQEIKPRGPRPLLSDITGRVEFYDQLTSNNEYWFYSQGGVSVNWSTVK